VIQSNAHPRDIAVELFDGAFDHALAVRNAWLPIVVWDDVRLRMMSSRRLTPLERFVIECLLELGGLWGRRPSRSRRHHRGDGGLASGESRAAWLGAAHRDERHSCHS